MIDVHNTAGTELGIGIEDVNQKMGKPQIAADDGSGLNPPKEKQCVEKQDYPAGRPAKGFASTQCWRSRIISLVPKRTTLARHALVSSNHEGRSGPT